MWFYLKFSFLAIMLRSKCSIYSYHNNIWHLPLLYEFRYVTDISDEDNDFEGVSKSSHRDVSDIKLIREDTTLWFQ